MKHILRVVSVALPVLCGVNIAMAFSPGVPTLSGPRSALYGTPANPSEAPVQKSTPKQKLQKGLKSDGSRSRARQTLPK